MKHEYIVIVRWDTKARTRGKKRMEALMPEVRKVFINCTAYGFLVPSPLLDRLLGANPDNRMATSTANKQD